ncbi:MULTISPECIES: glycogen/starch/alpha-glucan phosphorylase [Actinotignum]|uniref:Alpha-1,4 glucan phosphorylase n=1 Tax=Actinotignum timonense TaxID=1870995 RepID=A0AAW9HJA8_9ACTO|nr:MULTISPECIES: glycogen/starch/alpha-glucan phosphorylase [Actinotignum]MBS5748560.1 glycogen/starch/alpha-glucan phosphorylase [Actinotignum schaalii]MDE1558095.1 glycogen/starch/alpha-glucan phosphorylase [Actinotignum schaalii]MDE1662871.1 glycogen/starch/alpha-glucan phosphorylase [Actinotignum schaalii]MDK6374084.1 glycogen/starch/alpha-glucan phosphorylase [Actinotignum timonense]MDK6418947.1 glycogen/starch/alpha-glucan phosphorylase [Actinotignum timonense]
MSELTQPLGAFTRSVSGVSTSGSSLRDYWEGLSELTMSRLADNWEATTKKYREGQRASYFSAEFLMGRALLNNLVNLGLVDDARKALEDYGLNLTDVLDEEPDAALGNGGLGRLAACFMDSCATLNFPVVGYGILYRYGLFKQSFVDGFQKEEPDPWMENGSPFVVRRDSESKHVKFADMDVRAVPYDMPITGYGTANVNTLRLWKAEPLEEFDYDAFNSQRFTDAIVERERVNDLCRVLYPNDTTYEGKVLRVRQQYFFCSASLQCLIAEHKEAHGDIRSFGEYNSIQLNDTHPVLAIPELMRLLMDEEGLGWEDAWKIVSQTFAYTNHTVLAEALETWETSIFTKLFPRIYDIVAEMDRRFRAELAEAGFHPGKIEYMAPLSGGLVHMAWIACYASFSINGVAAIHSEILKRDTLHDWYDIWPERFNNKTNGVTPRRWLHNCNPRLAALLTEVLGDDSWVTDLDKLATIEDRGNADIYRRLMEIKAENKRDFARWIKRRDGIDIPTDAIYDTIIKRLHEYKRQLMNALYILDLYFRIKDNPSMEVPPRVFIFGAKAAPGYKRAKAIIKFINEVAKLVNNDADTRGKITVLFVENYNVSPAEHIIPATDISEQISLAGKEASGTGNMKFMMNGALTLGTMDGATVEIVDAVGEENAYIFGAREEELPELRAHYNPREQYETVPGLKRVLDALVDGTVSDGGTGEFHDLLGSLLDGSSWETPDVYYVLGDFADYRATRDRMAADYANQEEWGRKAWINICRSGRFSSDRTIADYGRDIWGVKATPIK